MPAHAYFRVESCMSCRERLRLRLHLSISLSNNAVTGSGALVLADLAHSRSLHAPGSNCPEAAFGITPCYIFGHGTKEAAGKPGCTAESERHLSLLCRCTDGRSCRTLGRGLAWQGLRNRHWPQLWPQAFYLTAHPTRRQSWAPRHVCAPKLRAVLTHSVS